MDANEVEFWKGERLHKKGFDLEKAEHAIGFLIRWNDFRQMKFIDIVEDYLRYEDFCYSGGTSTCHLCWLLNVKPMDVASQKRWRERHEKKERTFHVR